MKLLLRALLLSGGFGFLMLFPSTGQVSKQTSERIIKKKPVPSQPVEVVAIKNRKAVFSERNRIDDDDEWMGGLTVSLKNVSNKPITYIQVELDFPASHNLSDVKEPPLAFFLYFGTREKADGSTRPSVQPDESVDLTLSDDRYAVLKKTLREMNYSRSIRKIELTVSAVIFEDDVMWSFGSMMKRDPGDPNKWIMIKEARNDGPQKKPGRVTTGHNFNNQ
jgi:hypothetical protein